MDDIETTGVVPVEGDKLAPLATHAPYPRGRGRTTKLTPELTAFFVDRLAPPKAGFIKATCIEAGIHNTTFLNWMKRGEASSLLERVETAGAVPGEEGEAASSLGSGEEQYEDFFNRVSCAIAAAINECGSYFWLKDRKFWALSGPGKDYFTAPSQRLEMGEEGMPLSLVFNIVRRGDVVNGERIDSDPPLGQLAGPSQGD